MHTFDFVSKEVRNVYFLVLNMPFGRNSSIEESCSNSHKYYICIFAYAHMRHCPDLSMHILNRPYSLKRIQLWCKIIWCIMHPVGHQIYKLTSCFIIIWFAHWVYNLTWLTCIRFPCIDGHWLEHAFIRMLMQFSFKYKVS